MKKNKTTLQPTGFRVFLKAVNEEDTKKERSIGGIIIPDSTQNSTLAGIENNHIIVDIIAVGEKVTICKPGDRAVAKKANCWTLKAGEEALVYTNESDIMAVYR